MSFEAMRWAMDQPVKPALTKFVLVAMAECVNAEDTEAVCWPSYAFLCRRTGMNTKTVEHAVFSLKQWGYIVDTGRRAGGTGKVVVYRLNTTGIGCIQPGPQTPSANGTRPHNDTENGGIGLTGGAAEIPPNTAPNPPKSTSQSPQISQETPPKTGVRSRKEPVTGTKKESKGEARAPAIPGVPLELVADWQKVRKDKRAGPITQTVVKGLAREAAKAGLSLEQAVTFCCEAGWQGFNAGWYEERASKGRGLSAGQPPTTERQRRMAAAVGGLFTNQAGEDDSRTIDVEVRDVAPTAIR